MNDFDQARTLFDSYQQHGRIDVLQDSLNILNEIIESQGAELQKAINLKHTIEKYIDGQIKYIKVKYNVGELYNKDRQKHARS